MSRRVDPSLLYELKDFGAVGTQMCINCGNCTAICTLTSDEDRFPRHLIRLAQLGQKDELLGSQELWLCYNCGHCSETCPQQAEPANLMAAARCYAITEYAPFKVGRLFCRRPLLGTLGAVLMVLFFGAFMYSERMAMATDALRLFGFIPYKLIHSAGLAAMVLIGVISLATVATMISRITRIQQLTYPGFADGLWRHWLRALWDAVVVQALGQTRYRTMCEAPGNVGASFLSKWFVHAATMWGFLGLLLATALDYLLDIVGVKATGTFVPLWYPTRLIGTLSGLLFMYGVSVLLYKRVRTVDKAHSLSRPSDWIFLALLGLSGVTGFIIEIALYLPGAPEWGYWMFIFHVAVSLTLLLLLPFTKFAHAFYRTVALYIHALKPVARQRTASANAS
jgi:ferredoxin